MQEIPSNQLCNTFFTAINLLGLNIFSAFDYVKVPSGGNFYKSFEIINMLLE